MNRSFRQGMSAYRHVEINTRNVTQDQYELVSMMFDGVIESVTRAKGAIINPDLSTKVSEINRAMRILQEGLRTSLDLDNGGELAQNLANLYDYCVLRLTQANAQNNVEALDEVAGLIKPVADAWRQMRNTTSDQPASDSKATNDPLAKPVAPPAVRRVSHAYGAGLSLQGA